MSRKHEGIDPGSIILDDAGRFELNEALLARVSGGAKKESVEVIRGKTCKKEGADSGKVIRGKTCTAK